MKAPKPIEHHVRAVAAAILVAFAGTAGCSAGGEGIVLGTGGDGSFYSTGVFFEGAITSGCPDGNTVDDAIQANVVAAGYGK